MDLLITKVKVQNGELSMMSPHSIKYNGLEFRTAEALFQWLRFQNHIDVQNEIFIQQSPMGAKMKARKNRALLNRGEKWDEAPDDIPRMKMCMELKIQQHPDIRNFLFGTGNAVIIEDCTTHDRESARFWGAVKIDNNWVGQNVLGKLWMEVRGELLIPSKEIDSCN